MQPGHRWLHLHRHLLHRPHYLPGAQQLQRVGLQGAVHHSDQDQALPHPAVIRPEGDQWKADNLR